MKMLHWQKKIVVCGMAAAVAVALAACGGGGGGGGGAAGGGGSGSGGGGSGGGVTPPVVRYVLGGNVAGLASGAAITLKNGSDSVTVNANGNFTFPNKLDNGSSYVVTVSAAPAGHTCTVGNGSGTINGADVNSVTVTCMSTVLAGMETIVQRPVGLTADAAGNAYVLDQGNQVILKITPAGAISTLAGTNGEYGNRDGSGAAARFHFSAASRLALDSAGNLIASDTCNGTIRKITPAGDVTTLAGSMGGSCLNVAPQIPSMVDGPGATAQFSSPRSLASDGAGGVVVADFVRTGIVRKVSASGVVSTTTWPATSGVGAVTAVAASAGVLYVADLNSHIWKVVNDTPTFLAGNMMSPAHTEPLDGAGNVAEFASIQAMTVGADGNLYVTDNSIVRKVTPAGVVSTVAGSMTTGNVDGTGAAARFGLLGAISVAPDGSLLVLDRDQNTVRKVTTAGVVTTLGATPVVRGYVDAAGAAARLNPTVQIAADAQGNVYEADPFEHVIRKIAPDGTVSTFAGVRGTAGSANGALTAATFDNPRSVAAGANGVLYVAQGYGIRRIADGVVSTVNAQVHVEQLAVDSDGSVVATGSGGVFRFTADGVVTQLVDANKVAAALNKPVSSINFVPRALAFDAAGNLYISDPGTVTVYKLSKAGALTVFAGTPLVEQGDVDGAPGTATFGYYLVDYMAVDAQGNVYLSGQGKLRKISPAGVVSTPAVSWGDAVVHSIAYSNGKLYGATNFSVVQVAQP